MNDLERVVVVGASLAGMRAAETVRAQGFEGTVTVVGDEAHAPYDRPPLSKQVLTRDWDHARIALAAGAKDELDLTWERGVGATGLDLDAREVALADGRRIGFDGLVIATGSSPRTLPDRAVSGAGPDGSATPSGLFTLRTIDDALAIGRALDERPNRVVVVGAGFIGAEVAASCRARDVEVTLVEPLAQPLARVLGTEIGSVVAEVHMDHGVDLRLDVGVATVYCDGGRVRQVELTDGSTIDADLVVVGIGVTPNTGWLEGSGLTIDDGVVCDETTLAAPGVVAAGDVARWPNPRFGETMRVEHWEHAIEMGGHAAQRLLAGDDGGEPFAPVPWFWSDQYDRKLQLAGCARPDDEVVVVAGALAERRFTALFGRDGQVVGAFAMNMPAQVVRYRQAMVAGLSWDQAMADLTG